MENQDNMASLPRWYRDWISSYHGAVVMQSVDDVGEFHDLHIIEYGYWIANLILYRHMRTFRLPFWTVRLPIRIGTTIYMLVPGPLKNLYWKII